jgi:hypothetical protein
VEVGYLSHALRIVPVEPNEHFLLPLKLPILDWTGVMMPSMSMSSLNNPDRPSYITVECRLPAILHSSSALSVHRLTVSRLMHSLQRSTWPNFTLGWRHEEGLTVRPCLTRNQAYSWQDVHPSATTRTSVTRGTALQGNVGVHGKFRTCNRLEYSSRWHTSSHEISRRVVAYGYHTIVPHCWCPISVFLHVVLY